MSSQDSDDRQRGREVEAPYKVGNKKPPLHSRFKPGQSGNPRGRPKGSKKLSVALLEELRRTVCATVNGKPIRVTNAELFVAALVKDGITKGPQSKKLLLSAFRESEALEEEMEAASKKTAAEKPISEFSWTEERERLFQELERVVEARGHPTYRRSGRGPKEDTTHFPTAEADVGVEVSGGRLRFAPRANAVSIWGSQ